MRGFSCVAALPIYESAVSLLRIGLMDVSSTTGRHITCRIQVFYLLRRGPIDEMTDSDFLTMNRINATRRFKYTLQSHAPSAISVSHTLPSMQNPVGSQSNFSLGDRNHPPVTKKGSGEMMSPMYVRYSTARGRMRGWRKRSGFSMWVGEKKGCAGLTDSEMIRIIHFV